MYQTTIQGQTVEGTYKELINYIHLHKIEKICNGK